MGVESLGEDKKKNKKGSWVDDGIVVMDHHQKSRSTSSNYCYIKTNAEHFVMGEKKTQLGYYPVVPFKKKLTRFCASVRRRGHLSYCMVRKHVANGKHDALSTLMGQLKTSTT